MLRLRSWICLISVIAPIFASADTVVLLHGLARSDKAMNKIAKALRAEGYDVINVDYPSTSADIDTLTTQIFDELIPQIKTKQTVHFVTHSMGGTILHRYLDHHTLPNLGRVVMLAPPSRGSEVPDKLGRFKPYQWINGPAGNQLGTGTNSIPLQLKAPTFPLGIIAGDRSINPILSMLIPGPDDGKVAVERSKPAAYTDYCCLHATHACMVWNATVIEQIKHFLKHEAFFVDEGNLSQAPEWLRASFVLDKQEKLQSSLHAPEEQPDSPGLTKQDASSTKFEIRNTQYAIRNKEYSS